MSLLRRIVTLSALVLLVGSMLTRSTEAHPSRALPVGFSLTILDQSVDPLMATPALHDLLTSWLLVVVAPHWPIPPISMTMVITNMIRPSFHTVENGLPVSYATPNILYISHELVEMVADPWTTTIVFPDLLREVADPVETSFAVYPKVNGYALTDFVFPSWFAPDGKPPYDLLGVVPTPQTMCTGGYQIQRSDFPITIPLVPCWHVYYHVEY